MDGPKKKTRAPPAKKKRTKSTAAASAATPSSPAVAQAVMDVTAADDTDAPITVTSSPSDDENVVVRLCVDGSEDSSDDLLGAALASNNAASVLDDAYAPMAYNFDDEFYCETGRGGARRDDDLASSSSVFDARQKTVEVLSDFAEKSRAGEWPQDTSVACHWCCHAFSSQPVGLPISHANGRFAVLGVFCSLECACAHNFRTSDHMDEMWERNALINMMARLGGRDRTRGSVKPAPDRLALRMFGGHMSIDEFRAFSASSDKTLFVNVPPIMSATTLQLEEISDADLACHRHHRHPQAATDATTTKFVPLDHGRIDRYNTEMRIRRSKPISGPGGTSLEATMNVRFLNSTDAVSSTHGPGSPHPRGGARAGAP